MNTMHNSWFFNHTKFVEICKCLDMDLINENPLPQ